MATWQLKRQRDFTGGENLLLLPEFMQPNQLLTALNCSLSPEGVPETRKGKTALNDTLGAGGILSAFRFATENGTKYLVVQHGTSLYAVEATDLVYPIVFGTAVKTGLSAIALTGVVWKDNLILGNGVDASFRFDGTTCTDLAGTPPKFSIMEVYASRLWVVDSANPNLIRFSELEDYDTWDALDVINVRSGDGDVLTGLKAVPGGMVITKQNAVFPLYGTNRDDIRIDPPIDDNFGCVAPKSLLSAGLFVGATGIFSFSLTTVKPEFETHRTLIRAMGFAQKATCFGTVDKSERRAYFQIANDKTLAISQQTRIDTGSVYYSCFTWSGLNAGCFAVNDAVGDSGELLIGDKDNGIVYILNNDVDDAGTPIRTTIVTPYMDHDIVRQKIWRYFEHEIEAVYINDTIEYHSAVDVDYGKVFSAVDVSGRTTAVTTWDVDNWDEKNWGPFDRVDNQMWFNVQGNRASFALTSDIRIKYLGYITKFREVGYK